MADRESASSRGYNARWRKARETYLRSHPLCVMCGELGRVVPAIVVDHKVPHRGDTALFWDTNNWQALCKTCHDAHKQRLEKGGAAVGCTLAGIPINPSHHWGGGTKKSNPPKP